MESESKPNHFKELILGAALENFPAQKQKKVLVPRTQQK